MPSLGADEIFRVNGVPFSYTSARHKIEGVPYTGIQEISWSVSREGEYVHAARPDGTALGITSGLVKVDSLTFKTLVDTGNAICQQLALIGLGSFGNARWTYSVEIFEVASSPIVIVANGIKIEKVSMSASKSATELTLDFECKALNVLINGLGLANITV